MLTNGDIDCYGRLIDKMSDGCTGGDGYSSRPHVGRLTPQEREDFLAVLRKRDPFEVIDGVEETIPDWARISSDEVVGEPVLVLVTRVKPPDIGRRQWHRIRRQVGGYACRQAVLYASQIKTAAGLCPMLAALEENFFSTFWYGLPAADSDIVDYSYGIRKLFYFKLDIEVAYNWLEEAVYPFDLTENNCRRLTDDVGLIEDREQLARAGCVLALLCANSD